MKPLSNFSLYKTYLLNNFHKVFCFESFHDVKWNYLLSPGWKRWSRILTERREPGASWRENWESRKPSTWQPPGDDMTHDTWQPPGDDMTCDTWHITLDNLQVILVMIWHDTQETQNQFWILSFRRFVEVMTEYNRIQVQFTCSHPFCHFHCFVLPIPFFRDIFFWSDFLQVEYREQSKNKIKRQLEIAGKQATDEELEQMLEVSRYSLSPMRTIEKMKYFYQSS